MNQYLRQYALGTRVFSGLMALVFALGTVGNAYAQSLTLPQPGSMVVLSQSFTPALLKGIKVYADDSFKFDFILDKGDSPSRGTAPEEAVSPRTLPSEIGLEGKASQGANTDEANRLIKYFLASLTVPENDLWVNLSPFEKDRIVPDAFGETEMGRDLLAQDYLLKQITSSLLYPESEIGKVFWDKVYQRAYEEYGTIDIPVDTFHKVWVVPAEAVVYETRDAAFVGASRLKILLQDDYVAEKAQSTSHRTQEIDVFGGNVVRKKSHHAEIAISPLEPRKDENISTNILREIIVPELEQEVNLGKSFSALRQIYNSLILATWFKKKVQNGLMLRGYVDQNKTGGIGYMDAPLLRGGRRVEKIPHGEKIFELSQSPKSPLTGELLSIVQEGLPTRGHVPLNVSPSPLPSERGLNGKAAQGDTGTSNEVLDPQAIWEQYVESFKVGVYDFIKEEQNSLTGEVIPRQYFSGGAGLQLTPVFEARMFDRYSLGLLNHSLSDDAQVISVEMEREEVGFDAAQIEGKEIKFTDDVLVSEFKKDRNRRYINLNGAVVYPTMGYWYPSFDDVTRIIEQVERVAQEQERVVIVDIGTGSGFLPVYLSREIKKRKPSLSEKLIWVGIDPDEEKINFYQERLGLGKQKEMYVKDNVTLVVAQASEASSVIHDIVGKDEADIVLSSWMPRDVDLTPDILKLNPQMIIFSFPVEPGYAAGVKESFYPKGFEETLGWNVAAANDISGRVSIFFRSSDLLDAKVLSDGAQVVSVDMAKSDKDGHVINDVSEEKIAAFERELGIDRDQLATAMVRQPRIAGLNPARIRDDYERELGIGKKLLAESIVKHPALGSYNPARIRDDYERELGIGKKELAKLIVKFPQLAGLSAARVREEFELELGIGREDLSRSIIKFPRLAGYSPARVRDEWKRELEIEKEDVARLIFKHPVLVGYNPARVRDDWERNVGITKKELVKVIFKFPQLVGLNAARVREEFERELGIGREDLSRSIIKFPQLVGLNVEENLKSKLDIIRESGVPREQELAALIVLAGMNLKLVEVINEGVRERGSKVSIPFGLRNIYTKLNHKIKEAEGQSAVLLIKDKTRVDVLEAIIKPALDVILNQESSFDNAQGVFFDRTEISKGRNQKLNIQEANRIALEIWRAAVEQTGIRLSGDYKRLEDKRVRDILVENKLARGDQFAHSLIRTSISELMARNLGNTFDAVSRVWVIGSVSLGTTEIGPLSDIDLVVEVRAEENKKEVFQWIKAIDQELVEHFNTMLPPEYSPIETLFDIAGKIVTSSEVLKESNSFISSALALEPIFTNQNYIDDDFSDLAQVGQEFLFPQFNPETFSLEFIRMFQSFQDGRTLSLKEFSRFSNWGIPDVGFFPKDEQGYKRAFSKEEMDDIVLEVTKRMGLGRLPAMKMFLYRWNNFLQGENVSELKSTNFFLKTWPATQEYISRHYPEHRLVALARDGLLIHWLDSFKEGAADTNVRPQSIYFSLPTLSRESAKIQGLAEFQGSIKNIQGEAERLFAELKEGFTPLMSGSFSQLFIQRFNVWLDRNPQEENFLKKFLASQMKDLEGQERILIYDTIGRGISALVPAAFLKRIFPDQQVDVLLSFTADALGMSVNEEIPLPAFELGQWPFEVDGWGSSSGEISLVYQERGLLLWLTTMLLGYNRSVIGRDEELRGHVVMFNSREAYSFFFPSSTDAAEKADAFLSADAFFKVAQNQGLRAKQQDRFINTRIDFGHIPHGQGRLMAVMDGHGGSAVAQILKKSLEEVFKSAMKEHQGDIQVAMETTYQKLEEMTRRHSSGSTLSFVYLPEDEKAAYVFSVGDSPIFIVEEGSEEAIYSDAHNVSVAKELKYYKEWAIEQNLEEGRDYKFWQDGMGRVVYLLDPNTRKMIQVTRSFGDQSFRKLLIAKPVITKVDLNVKKQPVYIVIGSDGIYGMLDLFEQNYRNTLIRDFILKGFDAERLVQLAGGEKASDNVTVVQARLGSLGVLGAENQDTAEMDHLRTARLSEIENLFSIGYVSDGMFEDWRTAIAVKENEAVFIEKGKTYLSSMSPCLSVIVFNKEGSPVKMAHFPTRYFNEQIFYELLQDTFIGDYDYLLFPGPMGFASIKAEFIEKMRDAFASAGIKASRVLQYSPPELDPFDVNRRIQAVDLVVTPEGGLKAFYTNFDRTFGYVEEIIHKKSVSALSDAAEKVDQEDKIISLEEAVIFEKSLDPMIDFLFAASEIKKMRSQLREKLANEWDWLGAHDNVLDSFMEAALNIMLHGQGGFVKVSIRNLLGKRELVIEAEDKGPGIEDPNVFYERSKANHINTRTYLDDAVNGGEMASHGFGFRNIVFYPQQCIFESQGKFWKKEGKLESEIVFVDKGFSEIIKGSRWFLSWHELKRFSPPMIPASYSDSTDSVEVGGIDLTSDRLNIHTRSTGETVELNFTEAQLRSLQDSSGLMPIIIGIRPLENLAQFMGI